MDLAHSTVWWIAAGLLVGAELMVGTFHLLMLAIGAAAGALAAHLGVSLTQQIVIAAVVGGGAVVLAHWLRRRNPRTPADRNPDVNLDIGRSVTVEGWGADRTAQVHYRGAVWQARLVGDVLPAPGRFRIVAIHGSRLDLMPA